jgi:hypothetical protein
VVVEGAKTYFPPKRKNGLKPFLILWIIVLMKMKKRIAGDLAKILFSFTTEDLSDFKISRFSCRRFFPKIQDFFPGFSRFQTTLKT